MDKVDVSLRLALDSPENVRSSDVSLMSGFYKEDQLWELIVRYQGDLISAADKLILSAALLFMKYAIVVIKESDMDRFINLPEVLYVSKQNIFYEEAYIDGLTDSNIQTLYRPPLNLSGKGVLVGIIDSGINDIRTDFLDANGDTRVLAVWDQTMPGNPPPGYPVGTLYEGREVLSVQNDQTGHGTAIAKIVAGSGSMKGVAYDAKIVVVKLGSKLTKTSGIMMAVDFVLKMGIKYQMPVVINLSYGNNYGAHDGESVLERYLSDVANITKATFIIGAGNDGSSQRHISGELAAIYFLIDGNQKWMNLLHYSSFLDHFSFRLISPKGESSAWFRDEGEGFFRYESGEELAFAISSPSIYSTKRETYLSVTGEITSGVWKLDLQVENKVEGLFHAWLPVIGSVEGDLFFLDAISDTTINIPGTARNVITVGAYDYRNDSIPGFSGRGPTADRRMKPDLVAPGVAIKTPIAYTGTSMAAPFVSGVAALMMEWGIVNQNDPFLYGERVKSKLILNARRERLIKEWPNISWGYGALNAKDVF